MESFKLGNFLMENDEFIIESMMEAYETISFDDIHPSTISSNDSGIMDSWIMTEGASDVIRGLWNKIIAVMKKCVEGIKRAFKKYTRLVTEIKREASLAGGLKLDLNDEFFKAMKDACNKVYSAEGFEVIDKSEFKDLPNYCEKATGLTPEEASRINKTIFITSNDDYFIKAPFELNNDRYYFTNMDGMIKAIDLIKEKGLDGMIPYMKDVEKPQYVPIHIERFLDYEKLSDRLRAGVFESISASMYDPDRPEAGEVCDAFSNLSAWTMDLYLGLFYITLELFPVIEKFMVSKKEA